MLQLATPERDAVFHLKGFSVRYGLGIRLQNPSPIVGMNSGQESFVCAIESRLFEIENPIKLF